MTPYESPNCAPKTTFDIEAGRDSQSKHKVAHTSSAPGCSDAIFSMYLDI